MDYFFFGITYLEILGPPLPEREIGERGEEREK